MTRAGRDRATTTAATRRETMIRVCPTWRSRCAVRAVTDGANDGVGALSGTEGRVRLGHFGPDPGEAMLDADEARRRYVEMLTERVRRDRFPSVTQMNRIEAALTPETAGDYLEMLLEKIAQDTYPSPTMLARAENVAAQLPRRRPRQVEDRRARDEDDDYAEEDDE